MNYKLASAIIKGKWAIDPQFAINSLGMVSDILSGNIDVEKQTNEEPGYKKENVAVINIKGPLMKDDQFCGPSGMETMGNLVKYADKDPDIIGIVLNIDSPGGTVDGTENFSNIIKNTRKPVVAYLNGLMASAALWIGSSADEIIASNEMDEIGSVGVLLSFIDIQPMWEKQGAKFHNIVSNLSPDKIKMWEDLRAGKYEEYKKEVLDPLAARFQATIRENLPNVEDKHLTGKVFFAKDVMGIMVNSIGTLEDAIERTHQLYIETKKTENKNDENNSNQSIKMEKFEKLNKVLGVETIEMVDGFASLSEEMLETINNTLGESDSSKETSETALQNAINAINGIDESVKSAETIEDKAQAVVDYVNAIKAKPAGQNRDLAPTGDPKKPDEDPCTVKDTDTLAEAMGKISEEFNIRKK